jgi:hypothetical protein
VRILAKSIVIALIAVALIEAPVMAAPAPAGSAMSPLGVVLQADHAVIGAGEAAVGSTVFDGDALSAGNGGDLRVRFGNSQVYLLQNTGAIVHQSSNGFDTALSNGTVILSSSDAGSFRVLADGATIRPLTPGAASAQITRVGPSELVLTARKGALEVSMDDDVKTVAEGTSVRMLIQPPDAAAAAATPGSPRPSVLSAGRNRFIFILLVAIAIGVTVGVIEATLSPHKP